ncbi:MAG: Integrase family protein [uncultured bacterium]|nr:MAG: Integrase family protein [uncultured bacterium]
MGKLNGNNPNHPKRGSRITVDPIRDEKVVKQIKRKLKTSPRDYLLFVMGINNGLRISDLLDIKVNQVRNRAVGDPVPIIEKKTKKPNVLMINGAVHEALHLYLKSTTLNDSDYLFQSRNSDESGNPKPLTRETVSKMVKSWTDGLTGNYSTHSLRKTWGYFQRKKFGVSFEIICKRYNHTSPTITMRYLGIEDKEVNGILLNEI